MFINPQIYSSHSFTELQSSQDTFPSFVSINCLKKCELAAYKHSKTNSAAVGESSDETGL